MCYNTISKLDQLMKIAFLLYPTLHVKTDEDTSFWILYELKRRGHVVYHFESKDMAWMGGRVVARLSKSSLDPQNGFVRTRQETAWTRLDGMDLIFIRKEPPFDNEYLYNLQLLSLLKDDVIILNDPEAIAMCNEKMFILNFVDMIPDLLVTSDCAEATRFIRALKSAAVIKPLNNKGGAGIVKTDAKDRNLPSFLELATQKNSTKIMIQRYIPENAKGDTRILLLDGELLGSFVRKPTKRDFRANLSVGGTMHKAHLTKRHMAIAERVGSECKRRGLAFVGLDVIGPYLSEINVTSPSGIPEIHKLTGLSLEKKIADFIEGL